MKGPASKPESDETNIDHCRIQEGIVTAFKRGSQTRPKGISYYRIERRRRPDFEAERTHSEISGEQLLRFEELHFTNANRALPKRPVAHGTALLQNG
jgi:hypothetical protein